jgi:hypothetical protein
MAIPAITLLSSAVTAAQINNAKSDLSVRINDEFANNFIGVDQAKQVELLRALKPAQKEELFELIKSFVSGSRDAGSRGISEKALIVVGGNIITGGSQANYKDCAIDALFFFHDKVQRGGRWDINDRDADKFTAGQVLTAGNYNGCAEAAKTYEALLKEALAQKGFSYVEVSTVYSFRAEKAIAGDYSLNNDVAGHDLVEIRQNGEAFLVDPSLSSDCYDPENAQPGNRADLAELTRLTAIRAMPLNGQYEMVGYHYQLFGKGLKFSKQENASNRWDPNTSGGATRLAMKAYHDAKLK